MNNADHSPCHPLVCEGGLSGLSLASQFLSRAISALRPNRGPLVIECHSGPPVQAKDAC